MPLKKIYRKPGKYFYSPGKVLFACVYILYSSCGFGRLSAATTTAAARDLRARAQLLSIFRNPHKSPVPRSRAKRKLSGSSPLELPFRVLRHKSPRDLCNNNARIYIIYKNNLRSRRPEAIETPTLVFISTLPRFFLLRANTDSGSDFFFRFLLLICSPPVSFSTQISASPTFVVNLISFFANPDANRVVRNDECLRYYWYRFFLTICFS